MSVQVGKLDRKTVILFAVCVAIILIIRFAFMSDKTSAGVSQTRDAAKENSRLDRLRQVKASIAGKEDMVKLATAELAMRETGLLQSPTESQAQALLLETLNNLAHNNGINPQGGDFRDRPLSKDYGEIAVTVRLTCTIEQLVNLMAGLADNPKIIATNELRLMSGNDSKKKTLQAMLTVTGVVPRKLLPEKKGGSF